MKLDPLPPKPSPSDSFPNMPNCPTCDKLIDHDEIDEFYRNDGMCRGCYHGPDEQGEPGAWSGGFAENH